MTDAQPPGNDTNRADITSADTNSADTNSADTNSADTPSGMPAADSAGMPWSGRTLTGTGFEGDLGVADPGLLAALGSPQDEAGLMRAVAAARLLVPIVARPRQPDDSEAPMVEHSTEARHTRIHSSRATTSVESEPADSVESPADPVESGPVALGRAGATDLAVVTLTSADGQRGFPVFSSVAALSAWSEAARPIPVASAQAAQSAVTERCDVMLIDAGSDHEYVLRPSMLWALAQQREWLPAHTDPFVHEALSRATADEEDVVGCVGEGDPTSAANLRVVLSLRPGLDSAQVQALATRIGERIATDGEARARIDGLSFTIRQA